MFGSYFAHNVDSGEAKIVPAVLVCFGFAGSHLVLVSFPLHVTVFFFGIMLTLRNCAPKIN